MIWTATLNAVTCVAKFFPRWGRLNPTGPGFVCFVMAWWRWHTACAQQDWQVAATILLDFCMPWRNLSALVSVKSQSLLHPDCASGTSRARRKWHHARSQTFGFHNHSFSKKSAPVDQRQCTTPSLPTSDWLTPQRLPNWEWTWPEHMNMPCPLMRPEKFVSMGRALT